MKKDQLSEFDLANCVFQAPEKIPLVASENHNATSVHKSINQMSMFTKFFIHCLHVAHIPTICIHCESNSTMIGHFLHVLIVLYAGEDYLLWTL